MIGRSTIAELVARVAAKMDIQEINDTSVPTTDQTQQWVQDGLLRLLGLLPEDMLLTFVQKDPLIVGDGERYSSDYEGEGTPGAPEIPGTLNAVRILRVTFQGSPDNWPDDEVPCYIIPASDISPSRFLSARQNRLLEDPEGGPGTWGEWLFPHFQPTLGFEGASEGMVLSLADKINYDEEIPDDRALEPPRFLVEYIAAPRPVAEWPDSWRTPPLEWEEALVDYAVAQAKMQDEEMQQAQLIIQQWERKIAEMAQGGVYGHHTVPAGP